MDRVVMCLLLRVVEAGVGLNLWLPVLVVLLLLLLHVSLRVESESLIVTGLRRLGP
jgi:hypothetical protein